jgi:hypothetical protein
VVALALVVMVGSALTLVAGLDCVRASVRVPTPPRVDPVALVIGLAGAGLLLAALFQHYDGFSSLLSEVEEGGSWEFFLVPGVAVVLGLAGLFALAWWPGLGAGTLVAVGGQTAVHYVGVLIAASRAAGEVGDVGPAGFIGLFGGLVLAAAGVYARLADRSAPPGMRAP